MSAPWVVARRGHEEELVSVLQLLLRAHGYDVEPDGEFGATTENAVRAFQRDTRLRVDGVVGDETWPAIVMTVREGDEGDAVEALQRALVEHPGGPAELPPDGRFGPRTAAAVKAFQAGAAREGAALVDDGVAGPATWHALVTGASV